MKQPINYEDCIYMQGFFSRRLLKFKEIPSESVARFNSPCSREKCAGDFKQQISNCFSKYEVPSNYGMPFLPFI